MKKIKLWFLRILNLWGILSWIIVNALVMAWFFKVASLGWYYNDSEKIIYGEPGPGDGFLILFLFAILIIFLIFNLIALISIKRYIRITNDKRLLHAWFLISGLWFMAIIYDSHRSPIVVNPDNLPQAESKIPSK
jgi:hypothetical protein